MTGSKFRMVGCVERWRCLSRFEAPRELVLGGLLPRPTCGRRLAGVGELRKSLEDYVPLGHAGRHESGLLEQAPRAASHGLAGDDVKALHLLNFEPRYCSRAENPRNLR